MMPPIACKKLESCNVKFPRKCQKNLIFDTSYPLIPALRSFFKITVVSLFYFFLSGLWDIQRRTDKRMIT